MGSIYKVDSNSATPGTPWDTWAKAAHSFADLITGVGAANFVDDDIVLFASNHVASYTAAVSNAVVSSLRLVSVSTADDTYAKGADEATTNYAYTFGPTSNYKKWVIEGLKLGNIGGSSVVSAGGGGGLYGAMDLIDCDVYAQNTQDLCLRLSDPGGFYQLEECKFWLKDGDNAGIGVNPIGKFRFSKCSFETTYVNSPRLITPYGSSYQNPIVGTVEECDLSKFSLLMYCPTVPIIQCEFVRCVLKSGYALCNGTIKRGDHIRAKFCAVGALSKTPLGLYDSVAYGLTHGKQQTSVYRTGSDGENSWAYDLYTNASANRLDIGWLPQTLSKWHDATGSKQLTIYLLSDDSGLTDDEVGARVRWNSESGTADGEWLSTFATYGDGKAAGTSPYLKTDSSTWTEPGGPYTKYKLVIPGINPTEPGWIFYDFGLAVPSTHLWICPDVSLVDEA